VVLDLNLRGFTPPVREKRLPRIDEINKGVAIAAGVAPERMPTRLMKGTVDPLVNDKAVVARINSSLMTLMGEGKLMDQIPPLMG